jgi:hypothetical protein
MTSDENKSNSELAAGVMSPVLDAAARRLVQVLDEIDKTRVAPLEKALKAIIADPSGCVFCDSGKLRNPAKGHDGSCGYYMAEQVLVAPCGMTNPSYHNCPNMKEVGGGMEGERYRCAVCGKGYFLDYEEMK